MPSIALSWRRVCQRWPDSSIDVVGSFEETTCKGDHTSRWTNDSSTYVTNCLLTMSFIAITLRLCDNDGVVVSSMLWIPSNNNMHNISKWRVCIGGSITECHSSKLLEDCVTTIACLFHQFSIPKSFRLFCLLYKLCQSYNAWLQIFWVFVWGWL